MPSDPPLVFDGLNLDRRLPRSFYRRGVLGVAPDLIGKILVRRRGATLTAGRIVEVEAYGAGDDPASHAFGGPRERNRMMFGEPGFAYVYFIYGMYYCVNVVCEERGVAGACLIRALEPILGMEVMKKRRGLKDPVRLTSGPGKLCIAMAIDRALNGADFLGQTMWIANGGASGPVIRARRVGIRKATDRLWRFFEKDSRYVSK